MITVETAILPRDIDTSKYFLKAKLPYPIAIVARNIVSISQRQSANNQWLPFSWEDYQRLCTHNVYEIEQGFLNWLTKREYLNFESEKYSVTEKFFDAIEDYFI